MNDTLIDSAARREAQHYVKELRSFYVTLTIYALVNVVVWGYNLLQGGKLWAYWITFGWGLGLAIWGSRFYLRTNDWFFGRGWQEQQIEARLARENLKIVSKEKDSLQAQLRLLQAQIEPHFLFNTLANLQSLIERSPQQASSMLDGLIAYLRQSLTSSRATECTVATELALLQRYLELIKIRMGARLQYQIEMPAQINAVKFAPLLLQPLVENAIVHALEPKIEGGTVTIVGAVLPNNRVKIEVRDDGLGFKPSGNEGVGLSNVRGRLALLFDNQATLVVTDANPGTCAIVEFPARL